MIKKQKWWFFPIFRNMLLNIDIIFKIQYSTQYNQSYSRKIQIDNVDIMNAICKAMFLLNYSFITSRILMCLFLETCV